MTFWIPNIGDRVALWCSDERGVIIDMDADYDSDGMTWAAYRVRLDSGEIRTVMAGEMEKEGVESE